MPQTNEMCFSQLTYADDSRLIRSTANVGSGAVVSFVYPDVTVVYAFECYGGSLLSACWCPTSEHAFGRLMAFAAAVRWDAETD
jgi:hypothetical protein